MSPVTLNIKAHEAAVNLYLINFVSFTTKKIVNQR